MINVTYDEFKMMIEMGVEKEMSDILSAYRRKIKLAIKMIEADFDKESVIEMLKHALGE